MSREVLKSLYHQSLVKFIVQIHEARQHQRNVSLKRDTCMYFAASTSLSQRSKVFLVGDFVH